MKTLLRLSMLLLLWLTVARPEAQAQAEGTSFSCDGTFYQIRQVGATSSLYRVNRSAATYTTTLIRDLGVLLNGLSYNPQDGYMYALSTTGTSGTLPTSLQMYKIGQGGIRLLGTVSESGASTGLSTIQIASGTIDKNGYYYVSSQNSAGTANYNLYRFNIGAATPAARLVATPLRLRNAGNTANVNLTFYDIALNPADDLLYAVFNNGTLWRIDANGTSTNAPVTVIDATQTNTDPVGTAFFDVAGNLFVYTNGTVGTAGSGGFFQVNLTNGVYTSISSIDPASVSDGASCINPDQRIDIAKEATSITRVGTTGLVFDIAFTLRVKNTSTVTDDNVQINDFLWSGTAATVRANTTFSSTTGKLPTSVAIQGTPTLTADPTNINPVFALVRNTGFTGVGGAPGTTTASFLTGNQPLTPGQAAIITFTVRVTYPNTANVPGGVNNTAYASSTTGANTTGYSQQAAAAGFISSPNQLVASDLSTDGPSLPVVANGDTPTPTPVFFSTSIVGTVFEDINYGGGVGRTQLASNGVGVEGVRVELYTNAGAFLTFDITDAAGNYSFATTDGGTTALAANTNYQVRIVNQTVNSTRPGTDPSLLGIQTFKLGVTNQIGGTNPTRTDLPANTGTATGSGGQTLTQLQATNTAQVVQSILTVRTPTAAATSPVAAGVDFGFNFSTVVNTNDAGPGSLRQFILNSNALTNENLAQRSSVTGVVLTPGVEHAIFMLNDGTTTTNGLRAGSGVAATTVVPTGYNATTGFTFTPITALPNIEDEFTAIDGALQAVLTGNKVPVPPALPGSTRDETTTGPEITINFNNLKGLFVTGGSTLIKDLGLNNAKGSIGTTGTVIFSDGAGVTFSSISASGSTVTGVTTSGNARAGVRLELGVEDVSVTNNVLNGNTGVGTTLNGDGLQLIGTTNATITGNVINDNKGNGILLTTAANSGATISNNIIRRNGSGNSGGSIAGINIAVGNDNVVLGNTISGNTGDGIVALNTTSNNRFTQNSIFGNGDQGIDLSASATNAVAGDGVTLNANANVKPTGANDRLNFPIISRTSSNGGNLEISGYAPKNSTVEFFISDKTASAFGQGQTYLFTATEGSAADASSRIGNYSGLINGLNQGSETGASIFVFTIPISSLTSLTAAQRLSLTNGTAYLTSTATINGATSEFSGNAKIILAAPLPVTLVAFGAQAAGVNAQLSWKTAQEINNDHFVVERSFDGSSFVAVGQVKGQGTSQSATTYAYTDARVANLAPAGLVYYRLRQVDTDGTEALSEVQAVRFAQLVRTSLEVYPNPATAIQDAKLDLSGAPAGSYQVTLIDMTGRTLRTFSQNGGTVQTLQLTSLPNGTYLVRVQGNGQSFNRRVVKQ